MSTESIDQWFKLNKNITAPLNEWTKVTTDICQRMTQQNLTIAEENISRLSDQWKRLSNVRKIEDYLTLQKDVLNEDMSAAMKVAQDVTHTYMEAMEDLTKLGSTMQTHAPHSKSSSDRSAK
jgi:hypothetical protein